MEVRILEIDGAKARMLSALLGGLRSGNFMESVVQAALATLDGASSDSAEYASTAGAYLGMDAATQARVLAEAKEDGDDYSAEDDAKARAKMELIVGGGHGNDVMWWDEEKHALCVHDLGTEDCVGRYPLPRDNDDPLVKAALAYYKKMAPLWALVLAYQRDNIRMAATLNDADYEAWKTTTKPEYAAKLEAISPGFAAGNNINLAEFM